MAIKPSTRCWPIAGDFQCTSPFGKRYNSTSGKTETHHGIDLWKSTKSKTPILAITNGTITKVGYSKSYGYYVWLSGEDGSGSVYAHLSKQLVSVGQKVTAKTQVGFMGNTGNVRGAGGGWHLHLGISTNPDWSASHANNMALFFNPLDYLGVANTGNAKGKTFNGDGYVSTATGIDDPVNTQQGQSSSEQVQSQILQGSNLIRRYLEGSGESYLAVNMSGVSRDILYGRNYRIFVYCGKDGILDVSGLKCEFNIVKNWNSRDNKSVVKIYNLSVNDENRIIKNGSKVIVEAGYSGSIYGKIYEGQVFQIIRSKENGTDFVLSIISLDNTLYEAYDIINLSITARATMRSAISACVKSAKSSNVSEGIISDASTKIKYPRGKVLFGKTDQLLSQMGKTIDATCYVKDNAVNIVAAPDIESNEIFDISPDSGLIGTPLQIDYGISFVCLLNPCIRLNSLIRIDNSRVKASEFVFGNPAIPLDSAGIYRVVKTVHNGDTRGRNWYTEVEAITQAGTLPGLATNGNVLIN